VQEDVGHPVIGNDEAVSLGDVEPFDDAGELDDARRLVAEFAASAAVDFQTAARPLRSNSVRRHDAQRRRSVQALLAHASNPATTKISFGCEGKD
jgi:hypothetical protein